MTDDAGMLSPSARRELEATLRHFEEETSNQIVVVTFPSLEGEVLEDFSIRLAEQWKIGQKGKDNGIILLIFKNDRKVRIEVGYGLEGVLPDAACKLIIENEILPRFRQGKFNEGIEGAVQAILLATRGEYRPPPAPLAPWKDYFAAALLTGIFLGTLLPALLLWPLFASGIFLIGWGLLAGPYILFHWGLTLGIFPLIFYFLFGRSARGSSTLSRRGHRWDDSVFGGTGWGGGWGGGGFSGGGGSFGGGGASGSW